MQPDVFAKRTAQLNARIGDMSAEAALELILRGGIAGRVALLSSFGAESVVLLHMASRIDPDVPVLFIDTEFLFQETLDYQLALSEALGLGDVRRLRPDAAEIHLHDPDGDLHGRDADHCCYLRKTRSLHHALGDFTGWITGRKSHQASTRQSLEVFEFDRTANRYKINPLRHWSSSDLAAYIKLHDLPRHPLVAKGYPSIGCAPCTTPVAAGEDPRAGRWRDSGKTECGIHLTAGKLTRDEIQPS